MATRSEPPFTWVSARPELCPVWALRREETPGAVDALTPPPAGHDFHWAYEDEAAGRVRARAFAPDYGVSEDPATGSASILLCAALGRPIVIRQGEGSEILARPAACGIVELGGRVLAVEGR